MPIDSPASAIVAPALEVSDLHTYYHVKSGLVKAVNGVSFTLPADQTLGMVGESGCGKTVTALSILRLVQWPGKIESGSVKLFGRELTELDDEQLRAIRGREVAMVFQNAMSGLNPVLPVGEQIQEMITSHLNVSRGDAHRMTLGLLQRAGFPSASDLYSRYTFQLSGGMCQRVMITMAMALGPKILIADEPTSSLDVTIEASILEELRRLKEQNHMSLLLISHNLGIIAKMADHVAVMYAGSVVERADVIPLFQRPLHPYTAGLLAAVTRLDDVERGRAFSIRGSPPDPVDLPDQCAFLPRCHKAINDCRLEPRPALRELESGHWVACYNPIVHD